MDNQQPKVSDNDTGWVAGFFDGEGTIALTIRATAGKNHGPKIQPLAVISNTSALSLERFTTTLTNAGIAHHVSWYRPAGFMRTGEQYKMAWKVTMAGHKRASRFLQWITPFLTEKQERAQLALRYMALRSEHSDYRTPITDSELALALEMRELNRRDGRGLPYSTAMTLDAERPGASHEQLAANGLKGAEARWGNRELGSTTAR